MIRLELPNIKYKSTYIKAVEEFKELGSDNDSTDHYLEHDAQDLEKNFDKCVQSLIDRHNGINLKEGYVPDTSFWIIDENEKYCGRISLRHWLNEKLSFSGGHIGYDIIPSERGKGYATKALALCLIEAKKRDIPKVMLTCFDDNIGSIKTIEANGGVMQDKITDEKGKLTRRYFIDVSS